MEVEAFVADSVVVAEGKLYVQGGGWNVIHTQSLPTRHSRVGIGALVRVPYTATNQKHELELRIEDEDGNPIAIADASTEAASSSGKLHKIQAEFNVGRPATIAPGEEQLIPFAINLDGLVFDEAKAYRVVIDIDGRLRKALSFRINLVPGMRLAG